jgi:hypothetical protein
MRGSSHVDVVSVPAISCRMAFYKRWLRSKCGRAGRGTVVLAGEGPIFSSAPLEPFEIDEEIAPRLKVAWQSENVTYDQPTGELADIGMMDVKPNIRNKSIWGRFRAVF